jgi:SAM-dependent methyltransferase
MRYTFGHSEAAAKRLGEIAKVFNPRAAEFVRAYLPEHVGVAVDLGCGPGFTTEMLTAATGAKRVFGLDRSPDFLRMARERLPGCAFIEHDVTRTPFPYGAPEVLYARSLLSHLPGPVALVDRWADQLAPGGVLLIEELEAISTQVPVFRRYLEVNTALIASQGAELFVGKTLARGDYRNCLLCNALTGFPVPTCRAASWFLANVSTVWQTDPFIHISVPPAERESIRLDLTRLATLPPGESAIAWRMRRIGVTR